jgi:hypothetical protein
MFLMSLLPDSAACAALFARVFPAHVPRARRFMFIASLPDTVPIHLSRHKTAKG